MQKKACSKVNKKANSQSAIKPGSKKVSTIRQIAKRLAITTARK